VLIRRSEQQDAVAVAEVFCDSRRTLAFLTSVPIQDEVRRFLDRRIERGEVYVADEDGLVLGFIALSDTVLDHL
jgi:L-amino acid N-acyltransferase YncA